MRSMMGAGRAWRRTRRCACAQTQSLGIHASIASSPAAARHAGLRAQVEALPPLEPLQADVAAMQRSLRLLGPPAPPGEPARPPAVVTRKLAAALKDAQERLRAGTARAQAALAAEEAEIAALRPRVEAARPAVAQLRQELEDARAAAAAAEAETALLRQQLEVLRGSAYPPAEEITARPRVLPVY